MIRPSTKAQDPSVLPLHRTNPIMSKTPTPGASPASRQLHSALEKGLGMVGLNTTKAGSNEKERAYMVRQNSVLKLLLILIVLACCVAIFVFTTVLELHIARRGWVKAEVSHHVKEHAEHATLMRTNLELQRTLLRFQDETRAIDEFKSKLEKIGGTTEQEVEKILRDARVEEAVLAAYKAKQRGFRQQVEAALGQIILRFRKYSETVQSKLSQTSETIKRQVENDVEADAHFAKKLSEMGVDSDYAEGIAELYDEEHQRVIKDEAGEEQRRGELVAASDDVLGNELEVTEMVLRFFERLNEMNVPIVDPEVIGKWQTTLNGFVEAVEDSEKEVDLEVVTKRMESLMGETLSPELVPKFDATLHDSPIGFFQTYIEKTKAMPFKQTWLNVFERWKFKRSEAEAKLLRTSPNGELDDAKKRARMVVQADPSLSANTVLATIEGIVQENNLFHLLDWLSGAEWDQPLKPFESSM